MLVLALAVLVLAGVEFGADSRLADEARPTRWWPADPAN